MKWGVETIVNEAAGTVEIKVRTVNANEGEYHSSNYDMTFWSTREEADANYNQVYAAWQRNGNYHII